MLVPTLHITLDGQTMNPEYEVLSLDVFSEVNRIPWADITLLDGDAAASKFPISDSKDFDLGTKIKIGIDYLDKKDTMGQVFEGYVTRHSVEMDTRGQVLRIECRHPAHLMTKQRKSVSFPPNKKDSDLIDLVMADYAGKLNATKSGLEGPAHAEMVQYFATDWDFLLSRCQANGWLVVPKGGDIKIVGGAKVVTPVDKDKVMDFNLNEIFSIELALDAADQYQAASAQAWSFQDQKLTPESEVPGKKPSAGNVDPAKIAVLSASNTVRLLNAVVMPPPEIQAWCEGTMARSRLSFLRGRFETQGNAKVMLGETCSITGIGAKFNGPAFITGLRQRVNNSGWATDVQVGLPATPYHQKNDLADAPAGGLLPGVNGIQVGIVQKFKKDEGGQFRVQVFLPAMEKTTNLIWARWCTPTAGKGADGTRGMLFWPEEGDEVIVGFLNDDPRAAIVLGSLYNTQNAPLYPPDDKNFKKGLVTKAGSKLEFDDEKKEILLCTKEKLEVRINETDQALSIQEKGGGAVFKLSKDGISMEFGGNKLVISKDGIAMEGAGSKIELANSGVVIDSKSKLDMKAKSGAQLDGGPTVDIIGKMVELK